MDSTANLAQEVERLTQALADKDLALMEQTELADKCRKQAETLEAERDQATATERERAVKLAMQWSNAREPDSGGNALRNYAHALAIGTEVDERPSDYHWSKAAAPQQHAQAALSDEQLDEHINAVLRPSGTKIANYTMQKSRDDMRAAMRAILATRQPAPVADDDGPEFTVDDPDLDALLNAVADWKTTPQNMDTGLHMMSLLELVEDRLKAAPVAAAVQGEAKSLRDQWGRVDAEIGSKAMHVAAFDDGVNCAQAPADAVPSWGTDATKRLRSIVELLGLQSSVPDGDMTGYEFAVLGFVRREIERLRAASKDSEHPEFGAMREQATAWAAVVAVLTEVSPGWHSVDEPTTGIESATKAIRLLAHRAGKQSATDWCPECHARESSKDSERDAVIEEVARAFELLPKAYGEFTLNSVTRTIRRLKFSAMAAQQSEKTKERTNG